MTKHVRIENADTSDYEVVVETWDKAADGDVMVQMEVLKYPTSMATPYITDTRYIVIRELKHVPKV